MWKIQINANVTHTTESFPLIPLFLPHKPNSSGFPSQVEQNPNFLLWPGKSCWLEGKKKKKGTLSVMSWIIQCLIKDYSPGDTASQIALGNCS